MSSGVPDKLAIYEQKLHWREVSKRGMKKAPSKVAFADLYHKIGKSPKLLQVYMF